MKLGSAQRGPSHRSKIVFAVAVVAYLVGRTNPSPEVLALMALAVALAIYAHLAGRDDDRFAAIYAVLMGTGAAAVAGMVDWLV